MSLQQRKRLGELGAQIEASPVIDVIRARAYTSIREAPSQVLQDGHPTLRGVSFYGIHGWRAGSAILPLHDCQNQ